MKKKFNKMKKRWLFVLFALMASESFSSHLDFPELESVKYAIVIDGHPVKIGGDLTAPDDELPNTLTIPMTNKFGQKYSCVIPDLHHFDGHLSSEYSKDVPTLQEFETSILNVMESVSYVKTKQCLFFHNGWWSYEFCPGLDVKQYHAENGKNIGKTLLLGEFYRDQKWTEEGRSLPPSKIFHSQFYNLGSMCDLTNSPRTTEVRYFCEPNLLRDVIMKVEEPASCEYIVYVGTNKLCSIPEFKPAQIEEPKQITCHPTLSDTEYEKYLEYEQERTKLTEIRKKEMKEKEKQKMLQLLGDSVPKDVDINTAEGYKIIEELVEEKMTDRFILELEKLFDPSIFMDGTTGQSIYKDSVFKEAKSGTSNSKFDFLHLVNDIVENRRRKEKLENAKEDSKNLFDIEMERKVRSDIISEEDVIKDLENVFSSLKKSKQEGIQSFSETNQFQKVMKQSLKDIVQESEQELGSALDEEGKQELHEFGEKLKGLMKKLEETENHIQKMNDKINKVQDIIDQEEKEIEDLEGNQSIEKDGDFDYAEEELSLKRDNKRSVKKELREEDFPKEKRKIEDNDASYASPFQDNSLNVKVKLDQMSSRQISGLKPHEEENSSIDKVGKKVSKRLESVIKSKLAKAGLDTGGRQIEVKLVTTANLAGSDNDYSNVLFPEDDDTKENMNPEEAQQFQNMIYNLMTGNEKGYNEIDSQRKSERNYKFQWSDDLLEKARDLVSNSQFQDMNPSSENNDEE